MTEAPESIPQSLQDLLPKWAHFCLYTEKFITHELDVDLEGKHLLVGVSGGVDSVALLLVLHYLSKRNDFRLTAVHLNHSIRADATDDAAWVQDLCARLGVDCVAKVADIPALAEEMNIGLEEAGRHARYTLFHELSQSLPADFVAVAHHLDDLSEDVLMRFMRGTGWPGLSGMPGYDPKRQLIRPFLMLPKSTLIAFVKYAGIEWREDETNSDTAYTRNRVRDEILPLFLQENPNFRDSVGRLWKIGQIEQDYWTTMTSDMSEEIDNAVLEAAHKALRLRLFKATLDALGPGQPLAHTLFKLDEAWVEKRIGSTFQFPGDKTATITASGVVFGFKH